MRRLFTMLSVPLFAWAATACSSKKPCDQLAEKLCDGASQHCLEARAWIDAQGAADDAMCERVLDDGGALAAYRDRFLADMSPAPAPAAAATYGAPPAKKPSTKDEIRNVGETIEEIGETGRKTGDALDKIEDALDRDRRR